MEHTYIVHVDMDAFFAAIEQRDNPRYRGKPVIIGADPGQGAGRGVVSTCSYEARTYGIRSAMPISQAYRRCPRGIFLRPDMEKYGRVSRQVYEIFSCFTPCVEPVSIDEAFLDISGSFHLFGTPRQTCLKIKEKILDELRLTASVGCAPVKMAAKIASELKKPDGFVFVPAARLDGFLRPLPIGMLWGVGKKTEDALAGIAVHTIGELARRDPREIEACLGRQGLQLQELALGRDLRKVEPVEEIKSVSHEYTFERDEDDEGEIESVLMSLCEKVSRRLRRAGLRGRTVTVKIRLEGFLTYTRSVTLESGTNFADMIFRASRDLYTRFSRRKKVRLIGVRVSHFSEEGAQRTFFSDTDKNEKVHSAVDRLKDKFGEDVIRRAVQYNKGRG